MPLSKKYKFLEEVLSYIKFPFDRDDIKKELENHILDKTEFYTEQGYDEAQAEELSVRDMGDAVVIGVELNKQHNPIIGWVWQITNALVFLSVICSIFMIALPMAGTLFSGSGNLVDTIPSSNIVYKMDVNEQVRLDDRIINFTHLIYEKNKNMNIFYEHYTTSLRGGWSFGTIGEIKDNLGNTYFVGSGGSRGGIKNRSIRTVENFSEEADTLIIDYDYYNRSYRVEIPLPAGDKYEQT